MNGNYVVLTAAPEPGVRHMHDTCARVAPTGMYLQVPVQSLRPFRFRGENESCIGVRKKIAPNRWRLGLIPRRIFDPFLKLPCDEWPDAVKLGQRPASGDEIGREFRPKKGAPRRAAKGPNQNSRASLRLLRQELRQIAI